MKGIKTSKTTCYDISYLTQKKLCWRKFLRNRRLMIRLLLDKFFRANIIHAISCTKLLNKHKESYVK